MRSSLHGVGKYLVYENNHWLPTKCGSPKVPYTTGF